MTLDSRKVKEIRRLFEQFAKKLPTVEEAGAVRESQRPGPIEGHLLVRGNIVLTGLLANAYVDLVNKVHAYLQDEGTWSKPSVDDLLMTNIIAVFNSPTGQRAETIHDRSKQLVDILKVAPTEWIVDLQIAGVQPDCAGVKFGKIEFTVDKIDLSRFQPTQGIADVTLARTTVAAIDQESAKLAAEHLVDHHLAILNALCTDWLPSRIHLFRGENKPPMWQTVNRLRKPTENKWAHGSQSRITGTLLTKAELLNFLQLRGGNRVSDFLVNPTTFGNRLIVGYRTAGTACVEEEPSLAFLLFAIALESVVLGGHDKAEITFQLRARVAHLLGETAEHRGVVFDRVRNLYDVRSKIAHQGMSEVAEAELEEMRLVCLASLNVLTVSPDFASAQTSKDLEEWFRLKLLGAGVPSK